MAKARVTPRPKSTKVKPRKSQPEQLPVDQHCRQSFLESEICWHARSKAKDTKRQFQVVSTLFYNVSEVLEQVIKLEIRDAFKVDAHIANGLASELAASGTYQVVREAVNLLWEANDKLVDAARGLGAAHIYRVRRERTPENPRKRRLVAICFQPPESSDRTNVVSMPPIERSALVAGPIPIPEGERHEKAIAGD